ncbi:complex I intermediate-associated protein 30-domain-containing protein [Lipomyces japonicus]|uniref:complex I intermediate-associated protein 30-domain-containing protein n=1 Tax=Lipomyces japonicus TaxID=56871 RepID=UPI0034CD440F
MLKNYLSRTVQLLGLGVKNRVAPSMQELVEFPLVKFNGPESISQVLSRCDKEIGGYSTVAMEWDENEQAARFHGQLSLDLPASRPDVQRSGYAMFRTLDPPKDFRGKEILWDWQYLSHIALRVKGDRRKYFVNIQSKTALPTEIHQHRLFLYSPGEWETAVIPISSFLLTNWGRVESLQKLDRGRVRTIGIGLLDRQYGPFSLYVDWIKAINDDEAEKIIREQREKAVERRRKQNEQVKEDE